MPAPVGPWLRRLLPLLHLESLRVGAPAVHPPSRKRCTRPLAFGHRSRKRSQPFCGRHLAVSGRGMPRNDASHGKRSEGVWARHKPITPPDLPSCPEAGLSSHGRCRQAVSERDQTIQSEAAGTRCWGSRTRQPLDNVVTLLTLG